MRLTHQRRKLDKIELNIAAMIDVIMLLLIFFMCTMSFYEPEKQLDPAVSKPGTSSRPDYNKFEPVRVNIENIAEQVTIFCDTTRCRDLDQLYQELVQRRKVADVDVIIEGSEDVPFEYMVSAVDLAYKAGFTTAAYSLRSGSL